MKTIYILLLGCLIPIFSYAQAWQWARGNTGGGMDGWPVATDPSGNVFVAGISWGDPIFGSTVLKNGSSMGIYAGVVVKYDALGNLLWAKSTEKGNVYVMNIAADQLGNVYVFLSTFSASFQIDGVTITNPNAGSPTYFIIKFDASGNVTWVKTGCEVDNMYRTAGGFATVLSTGGIATDLANNVYVTCAYRKQSVIIGGNTLTNADATGNSSDIFTVKYDPSGNVVWAKSTGGTDFDYGYGITVTPIGDVYISGVYRSPSFSFGSSVLTNSTVSTEYAFIARYDGSGTPVWASGSGSVSSAFGIGLASDINNNVYMTGGFLGNNITLSGTTVSSPTPRRPVLYLAKFNPANGVDWSRTIYAGSISDTIPGFYSGVWGYCIALSQCGVIWVSGAMQDSVTIEDNILKVPVNSPDPIFVAGYHTYDGSYVGSAALQSGGDDQNGIACDRMGNLFLCSDYQSHVELIAGSDTLPKDDTAAECLYVAKAPFLKSSSEVAAGSIANICQDGQDVIKAKPGYSNYIWSDGHVGATHNFVDTGVLWVYGFDSCVSSPVDTFILGKNCDCLKSLFIPNAFTPNGDGQDDVFYPRSNGAIDKIESFRVYDRWGELLFERKGIAPNDASNAWDGTYRGDRSLPDVFVWTVQANCGGKIVDKKGSVTIIR